MAQLFQQCSIAKNAMQEKEKSIFVYKLAKAGAIAIGIVYVLIGVIALLSLMRVRFGGASESSVINLIEQVPLGKMAIVIILLGLVAYIIWKFYDAVEDPYGYGKSTKAIGKRLGIAAAGLAYGLIAYSALQALLSQYAGDVHGHPSEQQNMVAEIFQWTGGNWLVGIFAILVAFTGIAQFIYVIKKGYRDKLGVSAISKTKKRIITVLAWAGHFARGVILLIIAFFLIKAALMSNPSEVVNTDKAFNFLGEQVGHWSFVLVAVGTICYGFYMFFLSYYYDFQDDFTE
jgi:hypothetical protein